MASDPSLGFSKSRLDAKPRLDPVQKPRRFFRVGRVFAMRWVEPYSERESQSSNQHPTGSHEPDVFSEIRRFIVVHESHGASQCVPIHTYGGRGLRKSNIKIEDHARVFRNDDEHSTPPSEPRLREPIGVVIDKNSEFQRIHPESVANFGKVYTVEHDVAVANIGHVVRAHNYRLQLNWASSRSQAIAAPGSFGDDETMFLAPPLTSSESISPISNTTADLSEMPKKNHNQSTVDPTSDYTVLILCALSSEMAAVMVVLDEERHMSANEQYQPDHDDILGRVKNHNVVLAKRPAVMFGVEAISGVVQEMLQTYSFIRFVLVVKTRNEFLLQRRKDGRGEERISPITWAKGKVERSATFRSTKPIRPPSNVFIKALSRLQNQLEWGERQIGRDISEILRKYPAIRRKYDSLPPLTELPPQQQDWDHFALKRDESIYGIHSSKVGGAEAPESHQSNFVLNGQIRDSVAEYSLSEELTVSCSEAGGAGTILDFSFLEIQGIYDHSNSYKKNQGWQVYAAAAAAAYAKVLLGTITTEDVRQEKLVLQSDLYEIDEEQTQCHRVLKTSNYENFKDLNPNRVSNTCEWVLYRSEYEQWLQSSQDLLLWFSADPGCGKSVLSRFLIDHNLQHTEKHFVCYFFFKDNTMQDRLAVALCALLHQIFHYRPQLLRLAMDAFRKNGEKLQNEVDELWRIFVTAAKQIYSHSVICVLDGLDECQEDDQKKLFQLLGSFYNTPRPVKGPQLKFLITSRPYLDIEYLFHQLPLIRLDGEECSDAISKDINLMVKDGLCKLNLRPDVQDLLENRLITPSNRTYLWAHHVLEDLRDPRHKQTKKGFEKALKSLPKPLEVEYDKILNRVKHNRRHKAEILLRIVVDAYRPLTLSELDVAFELATGGQDAQTHDDLDLGLDGASIASRLRNLCGLFIYVDDSRIFLIHQSAKEYLVNIHYPRLALDESRPHSQMVKSPNKLLANICVQYLSLKDFSYDLHDVNSNDKESFYPLLEYSAIYLADHFRQATVDDDKLSAHIYELYDDHSQRFGNWYQISQATNSFKGAPKTSLQLAAFSGHLEMVSHFLKTKEFQKDTELWNMGEALYWAALGGNEQIVNILIENGSDVNANISEPLPTPSGECDKLDFMLLDSGADDISRSLLTASSKDHLRILRLLVDNYVYLNKQAKFDVDSLSNAYAGYQKSHGRLLLDCQDTNAHFAFYGNALQAAAQGGHTGVVQLLLNRDADVNVGGGFFGNALQAAARGGHSRVVELLLERGADINAPGGFYGSGLQAAARGGHKIIAEHLLDRGADVNTSRGFFGTALQAAARVGHKKIVRLLITKYADINAQGGLYGTALHAAIAGGYEDITMLFLEKGANPYAQGGFYGSIFEAATQTHHPRIVQLLNEKGFNDAQGDHRQTRHGSFQKFDNASADMRVDGNDLPTGADLAGFDDGRREDFILRAHQTYQPHHTSPSHPHLASSAHLQNEESSRPPKKRKWRS